MARRRSRSARSEPDVVDEMDEDDDEFAWQPKKSSRKKSTKKKKRKTSARSSTEGKRSGRSSTGKRKRSGSSKSASGRSSGKLSGSSVSKRGSGRRRRSSSEEDSGTSGRTRRGRSGRPGVARKKQGASPVLLISIVTGTILICLIIFFAANSGPTKIVEDQPAVLQQADELASQGMEAFRAWSKASQAGDASEKAKWNQAHSKLTQAMDMYNSVLDKYRDADGMLPPEYEGYEGPLSNISQYLIDLEKGSKVR